MAIIDNYVSSKQPRIYKDKDYQSLMDNLVEVNIEKFESHKKVFEEQFKTMNDNIHVDYQRPRSLKRKPIYDWETKNKSFLDLYNDLYNLGIKNNKFFLRLYDRELKGINPYQPNLPLELQLRICIECKINPYYFLREVARIPVDGKSIEIGGGTSYRIDRNNLAAWYLLLNGIDVYRSKPRQCGKTQDSLAFINYIYHFGTQSASILNFNKKAPDSQMNLARLKVQRDMLPAYMQMRLSIDDTGKIIKEVDNVKSMWNPITNNKIYCMASATGKEAARGMGRGFTSAIQLFDEFDFTPWNMEILDASSPAFTEAHRNTLANGAISARIFSSTPGDLNSRDGANATEFVQNMLEWKDTYLDMDINKFRNIAQSRAYNGVVFIEHHWPQLRKSMEWYEEMCMGVRYDPVVIAREIELKRIRGNSLSPFSQKDLYYLEHNIKDPIKEVDYSKTLTPIYIYEELDKDFHYILSVDPAEGLSQDNNAMTLINPYTQRVAAEFQSKYINQTELSKMIVKFMNDYCPRAMIVVENNRGRELIHRLQDTRYRSRVWYDKDRLDRKFSEKINEYGAPVYKTTLDQSYGFNTNPSSRNVMMTILEREVQENKKNIISKFVIEDILNLERTPSGKIEASRTAPNAHDDNVMSWLIGLCVYYHASNLEEYGIIRGQSQPEKYDPNDPKSVKKKIMELIEKLPESIRSQFNQYEDKNEVSDAWKYAKEIEEEQKKYKLANPQFMDKEDYEDYKHDEDAIFNNLQNSLLESDYYFNKHDNDFDVDDLI